MKDASTELGGAGSFLTTRWSLVLGAKEPAGKDYRDNLKALIRTYRKVGKLQRGREGALKRGGRPADRVARRHLG